MADITIPEEIQKEIILLSFYELKTNEQIAKSLNKKYKLDFDENDVQLYLQRKVPTDSATSIVLFDELKRNSLINDETNMALNQVSLFRARTFMRLHQELEGAVQNLQLFTNKWKNAGIKNACTDPTKKDEFEENPLDFFHPEIFSVYNKTLNNISKISMDLYKMADPVKVVTTGMNAITKEFTLEIATIVSEFIREVKGILQEDKEEECIQFVKKVGSKMNEVTEQYIEKVEMLAKNRTLGNSF